MNLENILTIALKVFALLLSSGALTAIIAYFKAKKAGDAKAKHDAEAAIAAAKETLVAGLPALVTEAELMFGKGAGALKLANVTLWAQDRIAGLLPDALRQAIPTEWISAQVDEALKAMRKLWAEKPELIDGKLASPIGFAAPAAEEGAAG